MAKLVLVFLCTVLACVAGQRITTIQLDGVQYFISRMNPYSPELNYFLAYQYCRSLGLQLASFETKEKVESMSTYLRNAGYSKYDFWTSGNRLGTGMFLWMSTGLPFNATFDYFENAEDSAKAGLLEPVDHNSNTTPQRTARDSSSVLSKNCVVMRGPNLRWVPEDCSAVKDFICEQTRCYYYNYGSIPVSSAQGRPITSTTARDSISYTTTPIPELLTSTLASLLARKNKVEEDILAKSASVETANALEEESHPNIEHHVQEEVPESAARDEDESFLSEEEGTEEEHDVEETGEETDEDDGEERSLHGAGDKGVELVQNIDESPEAPAVKVTVAADQPSVEQRLKQISEQIEKLGSGENNDGDLGHQSFLSLSDLIKTLRPNDKKAPQIDSDYSNTMRVLGEKSLITNSASEESRKLKDTSVESGKVVY